MVTKNVDTVKEKSSQKATQACSEEAILSVGELAKKLGIQPKRLRAFLRAEYPREIKGKKWEITATLAKKIEKDYKDKIRAKEESKKIGEILPEKEKIAINAEINKETKPESKIKEQGK